MDHVLKVLDVGKIKLMKKYQLRNIIKKLIAEQEKELQKKNLEKPVLKPKPKPKPEPKRLDLSPGDKGDKAVPLKGPKKGCMDPEALNYDPEAVYGDPSLCEYPEPVLDDSEQDIDNENTCCSELQSTINNYNSMAEEYETLLNAYYEFDNLYITSIQLSNQFSYDNEGNIDFEGNPGDTNSSPYSGVNNSLIFKDGTVSNLGVYTSNFTNGPEPHLIYSPVPPSPTLLGDMAIPNWSPTGSPFLVYNSSQGIISGVHNQEASCMIGSNLFGCINNYNQGIGYLINGSAASEDNLWAMYMETLEYFNDVLDPLQETDCCSTAARIGAPSELPTFEIPTV